MARNYLATSIQPVYMYIEITGVSCTHIAKTSELTLLAHFVLLILLQLLIIDKYHAYCISTCQAE